MEKTVSYEIEAAVPEHGGQYSCNATSIYGDSSQIINVKIIEIEVHIPEAQFIGIESQAEIEIPCIVWPDSKSSLQTKWSTYYEDNKNEIDPNLPGSTYKVMLCVGPSAVIECKASHNLNCKLGFRKQLSHFRIVEI